MTEEDMFSKWYDMLIKIKERAVMPGRLQKIIIWDALCEQRNNRFYGTLPLIKPFLLALVRKTISESVKK